MPKGVNKPVWAFKRILKDGCRDSLVLWGDILIDGHNRYSICKKYDIPFKTVQKEFASRDDAIMTIPEQSQNADILNTAIYAAVMPENSRCMRFMAWGVYNYTHNRKMPVWACIRLLWRKCRNKTRESPHYKKITAFRCREKGQFTQ